MAGTPDTHYARNDGAYLAYQVLGDGGPDLLFVPVGTFPIDMLWDDPTVAGHLRRLASFSRLILTDALGVGSSDPVSSTDNPAMQSWTDGLVAVLDAVGSESASVVAMGGSGLAALQLAAGRPQRVRSLVLCGAFARYVRASDHPLRNSRDDAREVPRRIREPLRHWCDRQHPGTKLGRRRRKAALVGAL